MDERESDERRVGVAGADEAVVLGDIEDDFGDEDLGVRPAEACSTDKVCESCGG